MAFGDHMPSLEAYDALGQEGFRLIPGSQLTRSSIPDGAGVYAFLLLGGERMLAAMNYVPNSDRKLWSPAGRHCHAYTGSTRHLWGRLQDHMVGDRFRSTFRRSLLAIEHEYGALSATGLAMPPAPNREAALTLWLSLYAVVAVMPCEDWGEVERGILARAGSPLNIRHRTPDSFSGRLDTIRRQLSLRDSWHDEPVGLSSPTNPMRLRARQGRHEGGANSFL